MRVLFLHGWQSTPGGRKPTYLASRGFTVLNPALPEHDFAECLRIAQAEYLAGRPDAVIGSSRGGAVAMNIDSGDTPLVLLCPAWKRWGAAKAVKPGTLILHSKADEVIPYTDSEELVHNSSAPPSTLMAVGADHSLADDVSLETLAAACSSAAAKNRMKC